MTTEQEGKIRLHMHRDMVLKWMGKDLAVWQMDNVTGREELTELVAGLELVEQRAWCKLLDSAFGIFDNQDITGEYVDTMTRLQNEVFAEFWEHRTLGRKIEGKP